MKKNLFIIIIISVVGLYFLGYFGLKFLSKSAILSDSKNNNIINNVKDDEFKIGGEFNLIDQYGKDFSIKNNLNKKYALIFFGYSSCKTICPKVLTNIFLTLKENKNLDNKFQTIFITLDSKKDTSEVLREFSKNFEDKFLFLTSGNEEYIKQVAKNYKIYHSLDSKTNEIDHSSIIYIVDQDANYLSHTFASTEDDLKKDLTNFLKNKK
jgi:protein SCO1/2